MSTKTSDVPALGPDDFKREQMKGPLDPISRAREAGPRVEALDFAPSEPYPTGAPDPAPVERVPHNQAKPEWYEPIPPAEPLARRKA